MLEVRGRVWCRASGDARAAERAADRRRLARRVVKKLNVAVPGTNLIGAVIVFAYFAFAFRPDVGGDVFATTSVNAIAAVVYFVVMGTVASVRGVFATRALRRWMHDDSPPSREEGRQILRLPERMVAFSALNWLGAVPLFFVLNLDHSLQLAVEVAVGITFAALAVCAATYLIVERIMRPVFAHVLAPDARPEGGTLGVEPRIMLTWALLCGLPLIGIGLIPIGRVPDEPRDLVAPIWFVIGVALVFGMVVMKLAAQAVSRPVRDLRRAMDAVAEGDADVSVPVNDASEIDRLQAGFNAMVEGLRERERLRELFGRQVGDDVAREALERGVTLGGQSRVVSALFVDVIGSTALAAREPPERVVAMLNDFFAAVVDSVARHGGLVNKFEGDGALCVFGAPVERDDHAAAALAAARDLRARLDEQRAAGSALDAAIGVSCGTVVAGHIGAEERYEYTVIGDPVNEAARLREIAKLRPEKLLASAGTVERAGEEEARHWHVDGEARLRGRSAPTRLAVPRTRPSERASAA